MAPSIVSSRVVRNGQFPFSLSFSFPLPHLPVRGDIGFKPLVYEIVHFQFRTALVWKMPDLDVSISIVCVSFSLAMMSFIGDCVTPKHALKGSKMLRSMRPKEGKSAENCIGCDMHPTKFFLLPPPPPTRQALWLCQNKASSKAMDDWSKL